MRISYEATSPYVTFLDVPVAKVFFSKERSGFWLKCGEKIAVCLESGVLVEFPAKEQVLQTTAHVVVTGPTPFAEYHAYGQR